MELVPEARTGKAWAREQDRTSDLMVVAGVAEGCCHMGCSTLSAPEGDCSRCPLVQFLDLGRVAGMAVGLFSPIQKEILVSLVHRAQEGGPFAGRQ